MNIKRVEFEVNGRTYFLAVKGKSIVFSNDLEVIGRFNRTNQGVVVGADQIFKFCYGYSPDLGDTLDYQFILKSMLEA